MPAGAFYARQFQVKRHATSPQSLWRRLQHCAIRGVVGFVGAGLRHGLELAAQMAVEHPVHAVNDGVAPANCEHVAPVSASR